MEGSGLLDDDIFVVVCWFFSVMAVVNGHFFLVFLIFFDQFLATFSNYRVICENNFKINL